MTRLVVISENSSSFLWVYSMNFELWYLFKRINGSKANFYELTEMRITNIVSRYSFIFSKPQRFLKELIRDENLKEVVHNFHFMLGSKVIFSCDECQFKVWTIKLK